jgi:hypothetical protein
MGNAGLRQTMVISQRHSGKGGRERTGGVQKCGIGKRNFLSIDADWSDDVGGQIVDRIWPSSLADITRHQTAYVQLVRDCSEQTPFPATPPLPE